MTRAATSEMDPVTRADRRQRLQALRRQVRGVLGSAADAPTATALPTGLSALDAVLVGGGLPRGRLTVLLGAGAMGLLHRLAAEATRAGTVAWLDPAGRLFPPALVAAGADLAEVLVVGDVAGPRLGRAAAILLRTGAVDLLVCDAPAADARLAERLSQLARHGATAVVLATADQPWASSIADVCLAVRRTAWRGDGLGLTGYAMTVTVCRQRGGRERVTATIAIDYPVALPPVPALDHWQRQPAAGALAMVRGA
ncbi:MAG: hypothetical protein IT340_13270 [Chloroflexi bacterium]|nr:hypothetical protein [Chloroflexota bacterium]